MNKTQQRMLDILKRLKDENRLIAVKAEFEAEGSRTDDIMMLSEVVFRADTHLNIKIGGCEAVRDLDQCFMFGASGVMAPMVETPFAMGKFIDAGNKIYGDMAGEIEWIINMETVTSHGNLDAILKRGQGFLNTVTIGRVDLSASMGLSRSEINNEAVFKITEDSARRIKEAGLSVGLGGGISFEAIPFMVQMGSLIDKYETRKLVFAGSSDERVIRKDIAGSLEFELLYLKNRSSYYGSISNTDRSRIEMLEQRVAQLQK